MCGIAGVLISAAGAREPLERNATAMADSLAHRGPDDHGLWSDPEAGVALGPSPPVHRRSVAGRPSADDFGRRPLRHQLQRRDLQFQDLRPELEARGVNFRGHSDTEVMLEAIAAYGIEATVKRLIGMFAMAVWDRRDRTLTLVRDRLGIKPLYWAKFGGLFLFGSELKALRAHPGWTPRIDRGAVAAFMRHNYIPAPAHDLRRRLQARARQHAHAALAGRTAHRALSGMRARSPVPASPIRSARATPS